MNASTMRVRMGVMSNGLSIIAQRLDALLDEQNESAAEIARRLGRSRSWLSNYRNGTNIPPADEIPRLCKELRCSADYLLGLSDKRTPAADLSFQIGEPQSPYGACEVTETKIEPAEDGLTLRIHVRCPQRGRG